MRTGKVKWFSSRLGYGYIVPDGEGPDVFVHYSQIEGSGYRNLSDNERVTYVEVDHGRGPQAQQVRRQR